MTSLNGSEQYMLELVNEERAQRGLAPLAVDEHLVDAARNHSAFLDDVDYKERAFRNEQGRPDPHIGEGRSDIQDRLEAADWSPSGAWRIAENVSFKPGKADQNVIDEQHTGLMNSEGHKAHILNSNFKTIGIGHDLGDYKGYSTAVYNTQNFATDTKNYFTGVAFDDADNDDRYDIGEGLGSVQVTIKDSLGNTVAVDKTGEGGGYSVALANGNYKAEFIGSGIDGVVEKEFSISGENKKIDLNADDETGTTPPVRPDDRNADNGDTSDAPLVKTIETPSLSDEEEKDVEKSNALLKPESNSETPSIDGNEVEPSKIAETQTLFQNDKMGDDNTVGTNGQNNGIGNIGDGVNGQNNGIGNTYPGSDGFETAASWFPDGFGSHFNFDPFWGSTPFGDDLKSETSKLDFGFEHEDLGSSWSDDNCFNLYLGLNFDDFSF